MKMIIMGMVGIMLNGKEITNYEYDSIKSV
jgi:hypothetical protein